MPYLFSKTSKIRINELTLQQFQNFAIIFNWFDEWWCCCFCCNGRCVLHNSSCLLVYENAPASVAARYLSWLGLLCFLAQVVWMCEEYNRILSIPAGADEIGHFGQYQYIGEAQISAQYIARPIFRSISAGNLLWKNWKLNYCCDRKARAACAQSFTLWQQAAIEIMCCNHSSPTLVILFYCSQASIGRDYTL